MDCSIRKPPDHGILTPPRRISLPIASFFGTTAQGIHCRLVALRRTKDISLDERSLFPLKRNSHDKKESSPLRGNYHTTSKIFVLQELHLRNTKSHLNIKEQFALLSRKQPYILYVAISDTRTVVACHA